MSLTTRPSNFREKVFFRKLRSQVDGNAKVEHGLTEISGIGRRFAQAVVRIAEINPDMRIGAIPEKDLNPSGVFTSIFLLSLNIFPTLV